MRGGLECRSAQISLLSMLVIPQENVNTEALVDLLSRLSACKYRFPQTFTVIGCKQRRNATGRNVMKYCSQLDYILIQQRERRTVQNCDTMIPLTQLKEKLLFCDLKLKDFRLLHLLVVLSFQALSDLWLSQRFSSAFA